MKLTESSGLRPFMAKHGADVKIFLRERISPSVMFDEGTDGSCCAFRSERERRSVTIGKRVHFLFHDVGGGADAAGKQRRDFKNRDADFVKAVPTRPLTGGFLDKPPARRLFRENILTALDAFDHRFIQLY
jgi:hypothetical protein